MKKLVQYWIILSSCAGLFNQTISGISRNEIQTPTKDPNLKELLLLHDQTALPSAEEGVPSQIFPDQATLDCQAADDFIVPDGETWVIHELIVKGWFTEPDISLPLSGVLSYFNHLDMSDKPEESPFYLIDLEVTLDEDGYFIISPPTFDFPPGHYWLSFQIIMPLSSGFFPG